MNINKLLNKLLNLREPLFYLLPLLALAYIIVTPARMEFSNVKSTRNENTEDIKLPYSFNGEKSEEFTVSFNLLTKNKSFVKFNIIPDDCIQEILINGGKFPLGGINGLCDYSKGAYFDFSKYVQEGLNFFEIRVLNHGGPGGLQFQATYNGFKSFSLMHYVLFCFFLLSIALILRKFKFEISLTNLKKIPFYILPILALLFYVFVEFCLRLQYELSEPFTWDTGMYWAVGRGIVNGITPWSGLFETKPPGIFLLSAVSYKIFGTSILTHYVQCFVLIVIAVIPVVFWFVFPYRSVWKFMICALFGFAMALYSAERAGEVQIESFGASFGCIAVFVFAYPNFYKRKKLWIAVSALGFLGACGFKEPFLFSLFGASILLCKDLKDWSYRFLLPLAIAVAIGFLLLLVLGWLGDYLHYYEFMQQYLVNRYGSPYKRAMQFQRLWEDMNAFSYGLGWVLVVLLFSPFILHKENLPNIAIKTLIAFLLTSYAVGLSGDYYNHHFIFAIPFYFALFALFLNAEKTKGENLNIASIILVLLSVTVLNIPDLNLEIRAINHNREKQKQLKEAAYVDTMLEKTGIKRYMYLGRNGNTVYSWTAHSPEGPYFFQFDVWLRDIPEYRETLFSMLLNSQLVVMGWSEDRVKEAVQPILDQYFTLEPWESVADIPRPEGTEYKIYYRRK